MFRCVSTLLTAFDERLSKLHESPPDEAVTRDDKLMSGADTTRLCISATNENCACCKQKQRDQ
jgi:hypothetical protein